MNHQWQAGAFSSFNPSEWRAASFLLGNWQTGRRQPFENFSFISSAIGNVLVQPYLWKGCFITLVLKSLGTWRTHCKKKKRYVNTRVQYFKKIGPGSDPAPWLVQIPNFFRRLRLTACRLPLNAMYTGRQRTNPDNNRKYAYLNSHKEFPFNNNYLYANQ